MDGPAAEALEPQDSDIPDTVELRPVSSSAKERSWSSSGTSLTDSDFASLTDRTADDEMTVDGNADDHEMASALNGYRILLVEDVAINQLLISFQLRDSGATVDVAENGQVGLDRIRHEESEGRHYDAILMDMQMPVLDGYEATRILRRQGYRRPIIALTAHALAGDREKTLECGCDDYATKPIDRAVLIDLISHCVSVSR